MWILGRPLTAVIETVTEITQSCFPATGTYPALGSGDGAAGKDVALESQAPLLRPAQTYTQVSPVLMAQ